MPKLSVSLMTSAAHNRFIQLLQAGSASQAQRVRQVTGVGQPPSWVAGGGPAQGAGARSAGAGQVGSAGGAGAGATTGQASSGSAVSSMGGMLAGMRSASKIPGGRPEGDSWEVQVNAYIDHLCSKIGAAHEEWRRLAHLEGVLIQATMAIGGRVIGPDIGALLMASPPIATTATEPFTAPIARGLAATWRRFELSIRVPGLPWYPSFAAVHGPQAPPTPNMPTPLSALTSPGQLWVAGLKADMQGQLSVRRPYSDELFDAVATGVVEAFDDWLPRQHIVNVMGFGPVPSFSPPAATVGAVVAGTILPKSGHFLDNQLQHRPGSATPTQPSGKRPPGA